MVTVRDQTIPLTVKEFEIFSLLIQNPKRVLGKNFPSKLVLTMYQVTGKKGWHGKKLWVPNIKLPGNIIYYDVIEEN